MDHLERGTSVVELLVAVTIFSVLTAIAVPSVITVRESFDRHFGKSQVEFALRRARSDSVDRGTRGILRFSKDGASYSFGFDYLPFSSAPIEDYVSFIRDLPPKVTVLGDPLVFSSQGFLVDVSGNPTDAKFILSYAGEEYCTGKIHSTGNIEYGC